MHKTQLTSGLYNISSTDKRGLVIRITGRIDIETADLFLINIGNEIKNKSSLCLTIDLDQSAYIDDYGAAVILELKNIVDNNKGVFNIIDTKNMGRSFFSAESSNKTNNDYVIKRNKSSNIFIRLGEASIREAYNIRFMISFAGSIALSFISVCMQPKTLRLEDTITCMDKTGVDALPIVGLISFLLGLIMAFMSSIQLKQFGANIYVASLVALAMVSELGPIMTAIVVAGRSGSAFAAEIGTMKISEEIDALYTMGFDPTKFLAVPRILASLIVVPMLTLFSDIFAVAGGLVVGVSMLNLTSTAYISQTLETLTLFDVLWGLMKSMIFAGLISSIGCLRGFQAKGGADSVGNAATSAVVSSIFLIILFDSICAIIRSAW